MGIVDDAIQQGIGDRRVWDRAVPGIDGELAGDERRTAGASSRRARTSQLRKSVATVTTNSA